MFVYVDRLLIVNVVSTSALSLHEMVLGSTFRYVFIPPPFSAFWALKTRIADTDDNGNRAPIQFFHDVDIGSITNRFVISNCPDIPCTVSCEGE